MNESRHESLGGPAAETLRRMVSFAVGSEKFVVDVTQVQEIIRPAPVSRVPKAPAFIEGVMNLRGQIIPVVDLRKRFGLETRAQDRDTRIVVMTLEKGMVGFIVDRALQVLQIGSEVVDPLPAGVAGREAEYLVGVVKREKELLLMLDAERILTEREKESLPSSADHR